MNSGYPIWHPYTQMQGAEVIKIARGEGAYVYDEHGVKYLDAVASWWTNIHGHAHPYIAERIAAQAKQLEHVIFAGFTHQPAIDLATALLKRIPFHSKVFFSDDGSTAVEVAVKMALQFWKNQGAKRHRIIAFKDAYHGDTFGAMSVSGRSLFTRAYDELLFEVIHIDTPREDNHEQVLEQLRDTLSDGSAAAFIFEPLVLGSAGMLMYPAELLDQMIGLCKEHNVLSIADEVMTGFGRTGKLLATDYCANKPDIVCLSKGITGGFLPFAVTTCTQQIYDAFLSDDKSKMFFHGHSYTANPIACAAATASLELFERENTFDAIARIARSHQAFKQRLQKLNSPVVVEVRALGTIIAIELKADGGYLSNIRDRAYKYFIDRQIILRPLGNVIYILPPYCISYADLETVYSAIEDFVETLHFVA